ncbi:MAG: clan AA aspartic protease [Candidatus Omnitrophica bacterium]|nr:clan AA aspartic protease [Candidatus Omnitrophota bacterium]
MIQGGISTNLDALLRLTLLGPDGGDYQIDSVIDTGFSGYLTLPRAVVSKMNFPWIGRAEALLADGSVATFDIHRGIVSWDGEIRVVEVEAVDTKSLVGMGLLLGYAVRMDVMVGGEVRMSRIGNEA